MLTPLPDRTGRPTISNPVPKLAPSTGMPVDTDTEATPGSACVRSRSVR